MTSEDRKLIERYLSGEGNSIDQMYNAERAREAVRRVMDNYFHLADLLNEMQEADSL